MKESSALVSVITPVLNGEAYIAESIESVLSQSYSNFELIIVDDGSTDCSTDIVHMYQEKESRIILTKNDNEPGAAGARNTGIGLAQGRYIAFLDCDDIWYHNKLSRQIKELQDSGAALVYSSYDIVADDGTSTGKRRIGPASLSYNALQLRNYIGCLTAIFDVEKCGKPLMPNIRMRQDWGLWLKILRVTKSNAIGIREPLAALRIRAGSLSRNKLSASYYNFRVLYKYERVPFARALYCVLMHSVGAIRDR